ncbi:hypothetical protein ACP70R_001970 [Stipagrostis hirtigluma subsp. patula]
MAEIVSSAVVGETVNRVVSSLIGMDEEKAKAAENIERLEMAHIKMESVLHMAEKWQFTTSVPLLRWHTKLKRAAHECDDTLRRCKQRALEEEETKQRVSRASLPKRIAHATNSFLSSFIASSSSNSNLSNGGSSDNVRRFERFADDANEFIKYVQFCGTPRQYMFFDPLIGHLLSGNTLRYQAFQGSKFYHLLIRPTSFAGRGVEANVGFVCQDFKSPTNNFYLGFMLRLSESTDIFGVIIKCLQSVTPHFKFAAEGIKRELIQLPTQDFSWVPLSPYCESEHCVDVHNTLTHWFRPSPLCCSEQEHNFGTSSGTKSTAATSSRLVSSIFPEEVIVVFLQCHVLLSDQHKNSMSPPDGNEKGSLNSAMQPLKLGALFVPHDSPEDIEPTAESYALEVIDEKEQGMVHNNASLQDLDEKLLPKAINFLYQNSESKMYQICLKSTHGTAHLCVEKTSAQMQSGRRSRTKTSRHARNRWVIQQQNTAQRWKQVYMDLLKFWVVRKSDKIHGSIKAWTGET